MYYTSKDDPKLLKELEECKCEHKEIDCNRKGWFVAECSDGRYNCCDCGGNNCGCSYCFSCRACESCLSE